MSTLKVDAIRHNSATSDAITTAADGTCTAKLTSIGGGGLSHRNLIINGAMQVAQRGTSSTSEGYQTVDRFTVDTNGVDEAPTYAQVDVASGTTPYTLGFRKAFKVTNGNQTSGAGASDYIQITTRLEAQDIATSGWNYTSTSSFITLSFYVKSSVAQVFSGSLRTFDNSSYSYKFDTPSLSADTWTKVTKTISGNSNLVFNNDNGRGLDINLFPFIGTTYTTANGDTETWVAASSANYANDMTSTWYTTNDATLEITGVQFEVGDTATTFDHRSIGDELARCQRYYYQVGPFQSDIFGQGRTDNDDVNMLVLIHYPVTMRSAPATLTTTGSAGNYDVRRDTTKGCSAVPTITAASSTHLAQVICQSSSHGWGTASPMQLQADGSGNAFLGFSAEI